jgi:hypothetical protein
MMIVFIADYSYSRDVLTACYVLSMFLAYVIAVVLLFTACLLHQQSGVVLVTLSGSRERTTDSIGVLYDD